MDCQSPESTSKNQRLDLQGNVPHLLQPVKRNESTSGRIEQRSRAVLQQEGKPIVFASKALTETEQRYANIERELLAVGFGCERFRTYLYGCKFQVESDHKPLEMVSLKNLIAAPHRLQRMLLRLQEYDLRHHLSSRQRDNLGRRILPSYQTRKPKRR